MIRIESPGQIIFRQDRVGMNGEVFCLYKFRTMFEARECARILHNEKDVTRIGLILRRWRLDEIPQFYNVLKGDMSIVGPRPTLPYQVERYNEEQLRRLSVRPGLTGWSQVNGNREELSWPARIALDLFYIDNWSILLDFIIMLLTPYTVVKARNLNAEKGFDEDEISRLN